VVCFLSAVYINKYIWCAKNNLKPLGFSYLLLLEHRIEILMKIFLFVVVLITNMALL